MTRVVAECTDIVREALKKPMGDILYDDEMTNELPEMLETVYGEKVIIAVGDMTTYNLLKFGVKLDMAVIDSKANGKTTNLPNLVDSFQNVYDVHNTANAITDDMIDVIESALGLVDKGQTVLVRVIGDEELTTIPLCVESVNQGIETLIIYGQFDVGIVVLDNCYAFTDAIELMEKMMDAVSDDEPRTKVLDKGVARCIYEPRGHAGLEGYALNRLYGFEYVQGSDNKKYYRVWPDESNRYETCGPTDFKKHFRIYNGVIGL